MTKVIMQGKDILVRTPNNYIEQSKARKIPQRRWLSAQKAWKCRASLANFDYINGAWPDAIWSEDAAIAWNVAVELKEKRAAVRNRGEVDTSCLDGVLFKMPPMPHQRVALTLGRDMPYFGYLMDQGTGKTKVDIDDTAHNFREDRIDAWIVIAPNSVKTNWVMWECHKEHEDDMDAIEAHMPDDIPVTKGVWISQPNGAEKKEWDAYLSELNAQSKRTKSLVILTVNVDALNVTRCFEFLLQFVKTFRTKITVDESTRIKNRASGRTKAAMALRSHCLLARILSGTPVIKRPLDSFAQFNFLSEDILGFGNFFSFRNHYAIMGGFKDKQVINYKNLDDLSDRIASCSYRVTKEECLPDLPPKVYLKRRVPLSAPQLKAYNQMKKDMLVEWKDDVINAPIVLTQLLRLQEIIGGYLPVMEDGKRVGTHEIIAPEKNPKFNQVLEVLDESGDSQVIVWCRFTAEIDGIYALLKKKGISAEKFYGATKERDRVSIRKRFARHEFKVLVAQTSAGGIGIDEFKAACYEVYVSNSHDTEQRVQSEDRAHRIGSEIHDNIFITDIITPGTVDTKIIYAIRHDLELSALIMKDGLKAWL